MRLYHFDYFAEHCGIGIFVLRLQIADRVIDVSLVLHTDPVMGMHQDGDLTSVLMTGKPLSRIWKRWFLKEKAPALSVFLLCFTQRMEPIFVSGEKGTKMGFSSGAMANLSFKEFLIFLFKETVRFLKVFHTTLCKLHRKPALPGVP